MKNSALPSLVPGLAAACVAAAVLLPPAPTPSEVQAVPVQLTSVAQAFDLSDPALAAAPISDLDLLEALDIPNAAGFISGPIFSTITYVLNSILSLVTWPLSWVGLSSLVLYPVYLVENIIGSIIAISPVAAVDVADLTGGFELPALPELALPDFDPGALGDAVQEAGAALLSLFG